MRGKRQTICEINEKVRKGSAAVMTEMELAGLLRDGVKAASIDVDIVTFAFSSSIRGCSAMLLVPVAGRGVFTRAKKIWLNGVPGYPGPAPNERLGVVDTQIFSDQTVGEQAGAVPAGTQLLIDVLEDREIRAECLSEEGDAYYSTFRREQLEFARMVTYNTFLPPRLNFDLKQRDTECSSPMSVGNKILLNRSTGIIIGSGTMSRKDRQSLSLSADMFHMDAACIGREPEVTISVAIPVPIRESGLKRAICASLAAGQGSPETETGGAEDRETASYLKQLILEGKFKITDSSFPIQH